MPFPSARGDCKEIIKMHGQYKNRNFPFPLQSTTQIFTLFIFLNVYKCCLEELLLTGAMWPNYLLFQYGKHSIDLLTIPIGLYSLIEIRRGNQKNY